MFTDLQCSDHSKDTDCIKLETKRGDTVWQFQQNRDRLLQRPSGQYEQSRQGRGTLGGGSDLSPGPIKIQSLDKYSAVSGPGGVLWCRLTINRPVLSRQIQSCYPPPLPSLSLRSILSWSIFNMWQWITSQLPCLVPQQISWLKTATSLTWWLCVGITTHHIMCTSLNSNSCREMVTSWLVTICSAQISSHNSQWAGLGQNIWKLSIPIILFNCE